MFFSEPRFSEAAPPIFAYYTFIQYKSYFIHKNGKKSVKIIKNIQKYT
jgi:hypothetical protein